MLFSKIPARAYLLIAVIIFAAANAVTRRLTDLGAANAIDGRNPISFCNVLFVGNLCALILLVLVYRQQLGQGIWQEFSRKDWFGLIFVAITSGAIAPALIFIALEKTAVNNVVLIGRIEPPLALALSVLFLGQRINRWVFFGALLSFIGVVLIVFLPAGNTVNMGQFQIGIGELMAAGGAVVGAIATIVSKVTLRNIPLGLFSILRNAIATAVFFTIAMILFGPIHFIDVFSPLLWQWMLVYGAGIVAIGQLCWFAGLKNSNAAEVSLANSFNPVAGILAAYLILGEIPTSAQYIGGAAIIGGIVLNQIGVMRSTDTNDMHRVRSAPEMDVETGFKGI